MYLSIGRIDEDAVDFKEDHDEGNGLHKFMVNDENNGCVEENPIDEAS